MRLVAGRIFVVNPHLLLTVCFDNLLEIYIFIAEADAALFIGKVDGMLRAVLDAGVDGTYDTHCVVLYLNDFFFHELWYG